jgi:hypothetical protein
MAPRSVLVAILVTVLGCGRLSAAALSLTLESRTLTASGATVGGEVVWFGIARVFNGYAIETVRHESTGKDEDRDGVVRLLLASDPPFQSYWFAVDFDSGELSVAAPPGYRVHSRELPAGAIPVALDWADMEGDYAHVFLLRPHVGYWLLRVGDNGVTDSDASSNGILRITPAAMRGVGNGPPPPQRLAPQDVLIAVFPNQMEFVVHRLVP